MGSQQGSHSRPHASTMSSHLVPPRFPLAMPLAFPALPALPPTDPSGAPHPTPSRYLQTLHRGSTPALLSSSLARTAAPATHRPATHRPPHTTVGVGGQAGTGVSTGPPSWLPSGPFTAVRLPATERTWVTGECAGHVQGRAKQGRARIEGCRWPGGGGGTTSNAARSRMYMQRKQRLQAWQRRAGRPAAAALFQSGSRF